MKIFAALISLLLLTGCTHRYEYYDFVDPAAVNVDGGKIFVFAHGNFNNTSRFPPTTKRMSPYYLVVRFETKDDPGREVNFVVTEFRTASGPIQTKNLASSTTTNRNNDRDKTSWAALLAENIDLPHETISIKGSVSYDGQIFKFSVHLHPKYSSEWRNDWLDGFISV